MHRARDAQLHGRRLFATEVTAVTAGSALFSHAHGGRCTTDGSPLSLDEAAGQLPAQEFDLHSAELPDALDPELRRIAVLGLLGQTNREIAGMPECTERKIERKLHLIRMQWEAD